jgi:pyrroloquinoline quinone biosynthesis protein E
MTKGIAAPTGMLAELTHRCPLRCPYCSNPVELERRSQELDTATWLRVLAEAARLGVIQVHLSGGEPTVRKDIAAIVRGCADLGLYSNLITSGIGIDEPKMTALAEAGLDHVQLSVQATTSETNDLIGGLDGSLAQKLETARLVTGLGLPLTLNAVIHRRNIAEIEDFVRLAVDMGARRVEIAHAQYYGWALRNRSLLMPTREQTLAAVETVERLRRGYAGTIVIDAVVPDYYARYPKACMGGWGRQSLNVTPSGKVLPCHAAETIRGLEFWTVRDRSLADIWAASPAFNAFRGTDWMREPCRSCERREIDWGGCRCQALAIAGAAEEADPVCCKSPVHERMETIAAAEAVEPLGDYYYRGFEKNAAPAPSEIAEAVS